MVPGDEAEARVDELLAAAGLARKGFIQVHPDVALALQDVDRGERTRSCCARLARRRPSHRASPARPTRASARSSRASSPQAARAGDRPLAASSRCASWRRSRRARGSSSASIPRRCTSPRPMGTPVVALFGPSGENEWGPWRVPHRVVTSAHPCRPCGNDGCGGGKVSECLTQLPVEQVPLGGERAAVAAVSAGRPAGPRSRRAWPWCAAATIPRAAPSASCRAPWPRSSAQGASLTIVTRSWPDHDGSRDRASIRSTSAACWRDASFARAVCARARAPPLRPRAVPRAHRVLRRLSRRRRRARANGSQQRARVQSPLARLATRAESAPSLPRSPPSARSSRRRGCAR